MSARLIRALFCALVSVALAAGAAAPARAEERPRLQERILSGSDIKEVQITATFSGEEVFVFGAIERNRFIRPVDGAPDIVVVVEGPSSPVMVRRKARVAGLWVNAEAIRIAAAPSFYAVASTGPLEAILRPDEDNTHRISLDKAVFIAGLPFSSADPESFRRAVIRLRAANGFYSVAPGGVDLQSKTLYRARFRLPASIIEGDYKVRVFLIRAGVVRDSQEITLPVRKQGLERALGAAAAETPLIYGIGTLLTALLAGWAASELFRRLRG